MKRRLALGVGVVLAAAGLLVLTGMSVGMGIACSTAATCLVLQHVQRGRVRASVGRLANAVRDLEVGCDIGVSGGTAANDPSAAIEDAAGRLRRLTQRCVDRLRTLTAQVAQLEGHHEETLAAVRGRTAFMASLCHEIRTPLNGLLGFLSMLNDSSLDDQQREWVDIARSSGESLLALLNDVLDLARIEAGKLTLERIEFDRDDLFENVAGLFAPTAHTRGVELLLHLDPGLPARLLGDPMRLRQVLANLVGNAVKFTSHGWIEITARAAERVGSKVALEITVADTGVGIPPERLAQLFVPFAQAEESTARRFGGSGLGLAIVKRIVEQMAGEISVDTELGRGTRFLVRLPISISGQAQAAPAPRPELALVIDGHDRRRELLGSMVQALGHETATAADAASALGALRAWAERSQPLVVIADDGAVLDDELIAGMRSRVGSRLIVLRPPAAAYDTVADGVDCVLVRPLRRAVLAAAIAGERHGAAPRGAASGPTWPGKRVLLVEDNAVNQRLMCTLLARMGVEVLLAGDGREAVTAFGRYTFDLILMDVQMPVMDGLEATQIIRSMQPSGPSVPIVALTANTQSGDREKCLLAGMNDYLTKPVRAAALRETMARFMPTSASALAGG